VLVVGNPANTNALIAASNAPNINPRNFSAMTRLVRTRDPLSLHMFLHSLVFLHCARHRCLSHWFRTTTEASLNSRCT
jgi:hypothetical protein